jgi:hypothetical protein
MEIKIMFYQNAVSRNTHYYVCAFIVFCAAYFPSLFAGAQNRNFRGLTEQLVSELKDSGHGVLNHVELCDRNANAERLATLADCCEIESLAWGEFPDGIVMSNAAIQEIAKMKELTWLSLYMSPSETIDWSLVASLTKLRFLRLGGNNSFSNKALKEWVDLTNIEALEIEGSFESNQGFEFLKCMPNLQELKIQTNNSLRLDPVRIVKHTKNLKNLSLRFAESLTPEQLVQLSEICGSTIESLEIRLNCQTSIAHLKKFQNLERLRVIWDQPTEIQFDFVADNPRLISVSMSKAIVDVEKVESIAKTHPALRVIIMSPVSRQSSSMFWQKDD